MEQHISHFLNCVARWTPRWFNKPKYHVVLHLPDHVRRFGPAILFATEAFESFNAVIRDKSIHSNRLAPSRDIAQGFAAGERIRFLLSGGKFLVPVDLLEEALHPGDLQVVASRGCILSPGKPASENHRMHVLRSCGGGPQAMLFPDQAISRYLGRNNTAKIHSTRYSLHMVTADLLYAIFNQ